MTDSNYSASSFRIRTVFPSAKKEKKRITNRFRCFWHVAHTHSILSKQDAVIVSVAGTQNDDIRPDFMCRLSQEAGIKRKDAACSKHITDKT